MSTKTIVVVDTVGNRETLSPKYFEALPFVDEWLFYEPRSVRGTKHHPHGGMCMEKAVLPLWSDEANIRAVFVRIFDEDGVIVPEMGDNWPFSALREVLGPASWCNNSWGAYAGAKLPGAAEKLEASWWKRIIVDTQSTVMWAAGNNGNYYPDENQDYPQGLLTDVSFKVGSADRWGTPSEWSGDSVKAPPVCVLWAEDVALLNPNTGEYDRGSGTSFAAPKATGLAAARGLSFEAFEALSETAAVYPPEFSSRRPHPKWGNGLLEYEYQKHIQDCPYRYEARGVKISASNHRWFDYKRCSSLDWKMSA